MLKVNIDTRRGDYYDYLHPFILEVLRRHTPDPVTDGVIHAHITNDFGLDINQSVIQTVLRRIARRDKLLRREHGVFHVVASIGKSSFDAKRAQATRSIDAVANALSTFAATKNIKFDVDAAFQHILTFLSRFSVECLRSYVRGTALADVPYQTPQALYIVGSFVQSVQETDELLFAQFIQIVKGRMLANALLCPDLDSLNKTFAGVQFYFDTPLILRILGLNGQPRRNAMLELVTLLNKLGGSCCVFEHTMNELDGVIEAAERYLEHPEGQGRLIDELRRQGKTRTDVTLLRERLDDLVVAERIAIRKTPPYLRDFQIDESAFGDMIEEEIQYRGKKAMEYDINSVRSIYALRAGRAPRRLEECRSVLVTSNAGFAKAAFEYGKSFDSSREVSSVITDFSLANVAWLKAPMGAPSLPEREVLAYCYAALEPSHKLWQKYVSEMDRLKEQGQILPRDHQILRYSFGARTELVALTLGDDEALTGGTVSEILSRVTAAISREKDEKLAAEIAVHEETQRSVQELRCQQAEQQQRIYWAASRAATCLSIGLAAVPTGAVIFLSLFSAGLLGGGIVVGICVIVAALTGFNSTVLGVSVRDMYERLRKWILMWILKRLRVWLRMNVEGEDVVTSDGE